MNFQVDSEKMKTAVSISGSCTSQANKVFSDASSLASLPLPKRFAGDSGLLSRIKSSASELKNSVVGLKTNCNSLYELATKAEQVGIADSEIYRENFNELMSQQKKNNEIIANFEKKYGENGKDGGLDVPFNEQTAYKNALAENRKIETQLVDLRRQNINANIVALDNAYPDDDMSSKIKSSLTSGTSAMAATIGTNISNLRINPNSTTTTGVNIDELYKNRRENNEIIAEFEKKYGEKGKDGGLDVSIKDQMAYSNALAENREIADHINKSRRENHTTTVTPTSQPIIKEDIDLSGMSQGYASSKTGEKVNLNTDYAKNLVYDKSNVVDGEEYWHFKQSDGTGYAWFKADDVREIVDNPTSAE